MLFVRESLRALEKLLYKSYGVKLRYIRAPSTAAASLIDFCGQVHASSVFMMKRYDGGPSFDMLKAHKVKLHAFPGYLMVEPHLVARHRNAPKKSGRFSHFCTLTDFVRMSDAVGHNYSSATPDIPSSPSHNFDTGDGAVVDFGAEQKLDDLGLYSAPAHGRDWGSSLLKHWSYGEEKAVKLMNDFLRSKFSRYEKDRSLADSRNTSSKLSPNLRFGVLSTRLFYKKMLERGGYKMSKVACRRLVWRDLAYFQLFLWPKMNHQPIRPSHRSQWWRPVTKGSEGHDLLTRWQKGQTGFPIIDAGMRELWATGWMQQNVRMVCAQFLCDILRISWVEGAKWFADTLVDADPAINAMMWQNAGRSGIDQWNFFLNPVTSARSSDPKGEYTRKWCPELRKLPTAKLHSPWDAPSNSLNVPYPSPCVEPKRIQHIVRDVTEEMLKVKRAAGPEWSDSGGYDLIASPRCFGEGGKIKVFTREKYRLVYAASHWKPPVIKHRQGAKAQRSTQSKKKKDSPPLTKFWARKANSAREEAMISSARRY